MNLQDLSFSIHTFLLSGMLLHSSRVFQVVNTQHNRYKTRMNTTACDGKFADNLCYFLLLALFFVIFASIICNSLTLRNGITIESRDRR